MTRGLYCYMGRLDDHFYNQPGHPLFQLYYMNALKEEFGVDKFDVYYYDKHSYAGRYENFFRVNTIQRWDLFKSLVNDDDLSLLEVIRNLSSYDYVFLKYRFLNFSRLNERSLDRLKFEELYNRCEHKSYIIDTDAEIKESYENIISLFLSGYPYPGKPVVRVVVPVLKKDMDLRNSIKRKSDILTFIGNEYFKGDISGLLEQIHLKCKIGIVVSGKWKENYFSNIIPRTERLEGYRSLAQSLCTVQKSKEVYDSYDFMSPRIFESFLLGTICFGKSSFLPKFCRYQTNLELIEKIKYLKQINGLVEYTKLLDSCIDEMYLNLSSFGISI